MRRTLVGYALRVSLLLWAKPAWASDDEAALKARVLETYPAALSALEARFASAFGSVTGVEEHFVGKPNHIRINGQFTFASKGPHFAKVVRVATLTRMNVQKAGLPKETVFCFNPENAFWLVKGEGKREFAVQSFAKDKEGQTFIRNQMPSWLFSYLHAPFSLGGPSMSSVIADGGAAIDHVSAVQQEGKTYLKIAFDFKNGKFRTLRNIAGWVLVAPEEKWVIQEYEFTDTRNVFRGRIEYAPPQDGFPVPKRVVVTHTVAGQPQPSDIDTYEFNELHFGDVADVDFRISAFGVAEPQKGQ
jgi:hypothetical protein